MPPERIYRYNVQWVGPQKRAVHDYWERKMQEEWNKIPRPTAPALVPPSPSRADRWVTLALVAALRCLGWIVGPFVRRG